MKEIIDSLEQKLQPVRKSFEALEKILQPWLRLSNEAQKERPRIASLIDSEKISFSEKIDQLPKIDPKILLAHLLIENMAEKKTGTKCQTAGKMQKRGKKESDLKQEIC